MECHKIENLLSPYLEDELSPREKQEVERHLESCSGCADLFNLLKETTRSLSSFPEVDVRPELFLELERIPEKKKRRIFILDILTRPALQPVMAAAGILLVLFSFYMFHPNRSGINKAVNRHLHMGYSKIERLFARTKSFTSSLGEYKDEIVVSLKNIKLFRGEEE
jgi:predicted anti-sigma-YlaC factor YlaD